MLVSGPDILLGSKRCDWLQQYPKNASEDKRTAELAELSRESM